MIGTYRLFAGNNRENCARRILGRLQVTQNAVVDVRGCKLNVRRAGRGEPLLFLHGAQGLNGPRAGLGAMAERIST